MIRFSLNVILLFLYLIGISQDVHQQNTSKHGVSRINSHLDHHYDTLIQVHDYSNNWDFDGDSIGDQLFFIGTGGAHLYFYPRIILSSDHIIKDFRRIETDFPMLQVEEKFENKSTFLERLIGFAVFENAGYRRACDLVIRLDKQSKADYYAECPEKHSSVLTIAMYNRDKVKD